MQEEMQLFISLHAAMFLEELKNQKIQTPDPGIQNF